MFSFSLFALCNPKFITVVVMSAIRFPSSCAVCISVTQTLSSKDHKPPSKTLSSNDMPRNPAADSHRTVPDHHHHFNPLPVIFLVTFVYVIPVVARQD
ncbi:hypothetical protein GE09DRAFT_1069316 [Coniochaeta sp. 2T2.1]|nr:hypothetical protein GE09DRAFT_1069316 [Coniochaeta sp. 2T2.1]